MKNGTRPFLLALLILTPLSCLGDQRFLYVSPTGNDQAAGTQDAPFLTLRAAQEEARSLAKTMSGDVIVTLAPGEYRLDRTLEFTDADSGRNGFRVIYRSSDGPGHAKLLGSARLQGWRSYRDGIWMVRTPPGRIFHTLYENGQRAWKARFPNHEFVPGFPTARGRYLRTEAGCKELTPGQGKLGDAWFIYRPEDAPPIPRGPQLQLAIFDCGKSDWMRCIYPVQNIDPATRRVTFAVDESPYGQLANEKFRVLGDARYFYEDDLELLDAPGEFFLDPRKQVLYYKPRTAGDPESLNITMPVVDTLIHVNGARNLRLEGLSLEETNDFPRTWWNCKYGQSDAAIVWLTNCHNIEIEQCHLVNGGRTGIMFIGSNTDHRVENCLIEHMGVNGITLCNRLPAANGDGPPNGGCQRNRIHNCRIHDIGEIHCYAECVTVFNASDNEISHCELYHSVRYAITLRGNTNAQFVEPHTFTNQPKCGGNRFHHLRIHHCGQDSGDMGAVHAANLNIPGGDAINTFEQIIVADLQPYPSMLDLPPDGIFLDWPSKSMHQVFRNFEVVRVAGRQLRSHKPENGDSAVTENVSWKPDFDPARMDYGNIGVTADFPAAYGRSPAPGNAP